MFQFDVLFADSLHESGPPRCAICRLHTGTWFQRAITPVGSATFGLAKLDFETNPCSRSPAGILCFSPPHCCGLLAPREVSLALYKLKNIFSSIFKFLEPERGLYSTSLIYRLDPEIYIAFIIKKYIATYLWNNHPFCFFILNVIWHPWPQLL